MCVESANFEDDISIRLNMFVMKSPVFPMSFLEGPLSKLKFESNLCLFHKIKCILMQLTMCSIRFL